MPLRFQDPQIPQSDLRRSPEKAQANLPAFMGCKIREMHNDGASLSSDALLFTTMCIIGLPVDVHVKGGSVYSGTFYTASLQDNYAIVLKKARMTKKGNCNTNLQNADVIETLVIRAEDLVQVVAKQVLLPAEGLPGNSNGDHTEAVGVPISSCESTGARTKTTKSSRSHLIAQHVDENRCSSRNENGDGHGFAPQRMSYRSNVLEDENKNSGSRGSKEEELINIPDSGRQVGDNGSQGRQREIGGKSDSQTKESAHEVQVSKPRLAVCGTQQAALESIPTDTSKVATSGECYDGPAKLDHQGDVRPPSALDLPTHDTIPPVPSNAIKESRFGYAAMPPPRSLSSNRISKEFKLNPGAKTFSPSLPQQRTATPPAVPSLPSIPDNYSVVPRPTSHPEVEINHFPPRSSLPVKFVPYGNMIAGNGGNDVQYSPPVVGHMTNRTQPIRYGAQYHPVQAGPTYVHPSSQNVMVGRLGQLVYVHPVSQDGVQGSIGFSQVSTCSLLTPHQIHLPKHQGTGAAQTLQMCVTPPPFIAAGQPQFTMPSHIPISQPHFPVIRPIPLPGSNGFLGSKFS